MTKFSFREYDSGDLPIIKFTLRTVVFNEKAVVMLGSPERICVGGNKEEKRIAFKAASIEDVEKRVTNSFANNEKNKKCVRKHFKFLNPYIEFREYFILRKEKRRFLAVLDKETNMVIIDLNNPIKENI